MQRAIYAFITVLAISVYLIAQQKPASKPDTSVRSNTGDSQAAAAAKAKRELAERLKENNEAFLKLQNSRTAIPTPALANPRYREQIRSLYRKPTKKERNTLRPAQTELSRFKEFLEQPKTGLLRLLPNDSCSRNTKVVVASETCAKYMIPGNGASYSFRVKNFRLRRLADVTYVSGSLISVGSLVDGIFVEIGNEPLDKITLDSKALRFLQSFVPARTMNMAYRNAQNFAKGVRRNGFVYGRAIYANENTTFALRSIAYRGKQLKAVAGVTYNEFDFDKRRDVIVAFRIVKKYDDGSIAVLWKELRNKKSPKLSSTR